MDITFVKFTCLDPSRFFDLLIICFLSFLNEVLNQVYANP